VVVRSGVGVSGYPVLVHPGTPGSRHLYPPTVEAAAACGLKLISWERPGYADRPGMPGRTVADGAAETGKIADALGIDRFATWGFSGGGPFSLACAALLPDRVTAAVVIASLSPYDPDSEWSSGWSPEHQAEVRRFFEDPTVARDNFRQEAEVFKQSLSAPDGWMQRWGDKAGKDAEHSREVADWLATSFGEAMKRGDEGWWEDWAAFLGPWGFDLGAIRTPVQLWHGAKDASAPASQGRQLANQIPGVDAHFTDEEDHTDIEFNHQAEGWKWILTVTQSGTSQQEQPLSP
jgi:pimeloyl-ACP methyl ester carboxylesterase